MGGNILENKNRNGNYTSSGIVALTVMGSRRMTESELADHKKANPGSRILTTETWPGEKGITYIHQKNMERRLGRSLQVDIDTKATNWGHLCEKVLFDLLDTSYTICSNDTMTHERYPFWKGTPDIIKHDEGRTVGDIKCPYTLTSFCQLVTPLYVGMTGMDAMNAIRFGYTDEKTGLPVKAHSDGEKFYWQLVSNACIAKCKYAELIVYAPYQGHLDQIRIEAEGNQRYYFAWASVDGELPFLVEGAGYNDINVIRFEVPLADKILLENYVAKAGKYLINV